MNNMTGAGKLAAAMQKRMNDVSRHNSTIFLELGLITDAFGLKLDSLSEAIPAGDYMICKSLKIEDMETEETVVDGCESYIPHKHEIKLSEANKLEPGMRVLVGWASGEPVVIDVVVKDG